MVKIASFVFFDVETTGLPHQERNKTKITELSFIAVLRNDIEQASIGSKPYVSKLTLLFNPQRKIHPEVTILTGLSNESLKNAPAFKDNIEIILSFLKALPKPVCLVAHNGNRFDYKLLLTEFLDVNFSLPQELLCVDSLTGFQHIFKSINSTNLPNARKDDEKRKDESSVKNNSPQDDSILEEDSLAKDSYLLISEDSLISEDWPDLDVSNEEWKEIDSLCSSLSDMAFEAPNMSRNLDECKETQRSSMEKCGSEKLSYTLSSLYRRLLKKEVYNAHRAEDDCMMLLECVVATKEFLPWADRSCKSIYDIKPFDRNKFKKNIFSTSSPSSSG